MIFFQRFLLLFGLLVFPSMVLAGGSFNYVEDGRWVKVAKVFDGDTFKTSKGLKVRLLGINTPEIPHGAKQGQVMGYAASKALQGLLGGKTVRLSFDRERKDRYGRTLAHVWLRDGGWVNGMLVAQGYAHVYTFAPNFHSIDALLALEKKAITAKRGIWHTPRFSVITAAAINNQNIGEFRVVDGTVGAIIDKHGWYFKFGKLRVSVPKKYRRWFKKPPAINHLGAKIRLRGRIRTANNGALYLALHSPYDLQWLHDEPHK